MILEYIIIFLLGYAIGKTPFIFQYLQVRKENMQLKQDVIILKEHLSKTGRGKIINTAVQDEP